MKKRIFFLILALLISISLAVPGLAEGAEQGIRWLNFKLPDEVVKYPDGFSVSFIEELNWISFEGDPELLAGGVEDLDNINYVFDVKNGNKLKYRSVKYLTNDLLLAEKVNKDFVILDLNGSELTELGSGIVSWRGGELFTMGNSRNRHVLFNSKGEIISTIYNAKKSQDGSLYIIYDDTGLYGLMDSQWNVLISPKYRALEGSHGLYWAQNNEGYWGVIDMGENVVMPFTYTTEETWAMPIYHGTIYARNEDGLWGAYNSEGKQIVPFQYKGFVIGNSEPFLTLGYADYTVLKSRDISTLADLNTEGYLIFKNSEGLLGAFDTAGKQVLPFEYSNIEGFNNGFAIVSSASSGLCGVVDDKGKTVLPVEYDSCYFLSDRLFLVEKETKVRIIDTANGSTLLSIDEAGSYRNGYGIYTVEKSDDSTTTLMFINSKTICIQPDESLYIMNPSEGIFTGTFIVTPSSEGWMPYGLIDIAHSKILLPSEYDRIVCCSDYNDIFDEAPTGRYFLVKKGDNLGVFTNPYYGLEDAGLMQPQPPDTEQPEETQKPEGNIADDTPDIKKDETTKREPETENSTSSLWRWIAIGLGVAFIAVVAALVIIPLRKKRNAQKITKETTCNSIVPANQLEQAKKYNGNNVPNFCIYCGTRLPPEAKYCPNCGKNANHV